GARTLDLSHRVCSTVHNSTGRATRKQLPAAANVGLACAVVNGRARRDLLLVAISHPVTA
ncbi:MAG: hypothetical protein WD099_00450, partial [Dongiaceae bacterium]